MRALAAFFVALPISLLCASSASAYTHTGNTYTLVTGDFCIGCHSTGSVPAPDITITQVTPDPLTVGGSAVFEIKLHSNRADSSSSFAGFAAGAKVGAGTFKANDPADDPDHSTEVCSGSGGLTGCPSGFTATRDISLRSWDAAGTYTWDITLENLGAGDFNLFVGGNDANGDDTIAGDHNNHNKLAFHVPGGAGEGEGAAGEGEGGAGEGEGAAGEGEGEGTTPPPGCSSVTSGTAVPFGGLACLVAVGAMASRRRRRR